MKDWKEKIRQSDAGLARPDLAEALIGTVGSERAGASEKNGAEVLELSPLVGSPSQVPRSPSSVGAKGVAETVREEVLALAPIIKALVRRDIREAEERPDE